MEINPKFHQVSRASILFRGMGFEVKYEEDILKIEAYSITPTVRAENITGNENEISVSPAFAPEEEESEFEGSYGPD